MTLLTKELLVCAEKNCEFIVLPPRISHLLISFLVSQLGYHAMSTSENAKSVHVKEDGAQQFLTRLETVIKKTLSDDEITKMMKKEVSPTIIQTVPHNRKWAIRKSHCDCPVSQLH
eukprot:GFKZ01015922.1.p2 GENE.GFKZ01015922.1~~GFKZ01015922.1.p2  ORF type:complete len:116 (+),score=19.52 GFKZ01015922.1:496-843(+)